jgi:2,3-bisphosphoglycerate-independent phosphoglycerate mutase
MMEKSFDILNNHPLNLARAAKGENKGNSLWFWGAGTKPHLGAFYEKTGLKGAMISAVDLLKGIAVGAGMTVYEVEGATGSLHTNYEGKADAAIRALQEDGHDFVYVHLEGPDEMAHQGLTAEKIQSIEYLDSRIVAPIVNAMEAAGETYRILILPDHPNPVCYRTHTPDPVPYLLYDSMNKNGCGCAYSERIGRESGIFEPEGYKLLNRFLK